MREQKCVYIATTFDTKQAEADFVKKMVLAAGVKAVTVDLSTREKRQNSLVNYNNVTVARALHNGEEKIFCNDRGSAISGMAEAFSEFMSSRDDVGGVIGLGGSGGTALIAPALKKLPIGLPKIMVSTMASGDVGSYVGDSDISMMYSVTDIAGLNGVLKSILTNAAHSIAGQVAFSSNANTEESENKPAIGMTMFGVTTPCASAISHQLNSDFDCLIFHATGSGGATMERFSREGLVDGLIDLTTTEICDYLFDGVLACKSDRLDVVAETKIPYVGSCGALDMVNFGAMDTVPEKYAERLLYPHNAQVTLMRTTAEECAKLGRWIGNKLNKCEGDVRFLIPEKGISALDAPGSPFWDPDADKALFDALKETVIITEKRRLISVPNHINDTEFANRVVDEFLSINH